MASFPFTKPKYRVVVAQQIGLLIGEGIRAVFALACAAGVVMSCIVLAGAR